MSRTVRRLRIYDLTEDLTAKVKRKLTYNYKHEDDENFNEIYHPDKLFKLVEDWMSEHGLTPDHTREANITGFFDVSIIESDSGRLGYLSIDGEPGAWELTITYPKEGESIFDMEEVTLLPTEAQF